VKILVVHNLYQQPGGEDIVLTSEKGLLKARGHDVVEYVRHNDDIARYGLWRKATLAARTVWAWDSYNEIKALLARERPDVAHFHNTFPLISPAAYYACQDRGVPVVQTLHNYRLLCPSGTFFRRGRICEECLDHSLCRAALHGCYRSSRAATTTMAVMLAFHRWLGTWTRAVACYIALTEFARTKFIESGLPAEKIVVKPNFVHPDPCPDAGNASTGPEYAIFIGRLSEEKGARTLVEAWMHLNGGVPLLIAGDGPLKPPIEQQVARLSLSSVSLVGRVAHEQVARLLRAARFLVAPTGCYETFGLAAVEAFACGVPVLAPRFGAVG